MIIKIKGHSNFSVKLIYENNNYYITKSASNIIEFERLKKQINKQIKFYEKNLLKNFNTPKIIYKSSENYKYVMEYIKHSETIIEFIEKYNIRTIDWFISRIIKLVEHEIKESEMKIISKYILVDKLKMIKNNILENEIIKFDNKKFIFDTIDKLLIYIQNNIIKIPIGNCHGDLTFSNILIEHSNMEIYLIDFLDSFIESPLIDIVKIRQDTKYYWTLNLYLDKFDEVKFKIVMNYIDIKITKCFSRYDFYKNHYKLFEIINLLRILQYTKNTNISDYILSTIKLI